MTLREAMQRLSVHRMHMRPCGRSFVVQFNEDRVIDETNSYITDDLEDAVIQAGKMRRKRLQVI